MTSESNLLGTFAYGYVGNTGRLDTVSRGAWVLSDFDYYPGAPGAPGTGNGDLRLQSIKHQRHAGGGVQAVQSQFDYEYTVAGNISRWNQRWNGLSGGADYHLGYDAADQLLGAEVRDPISGVLQKTYGYVYDPAANRTLEQTSTHGGAQQEITLSRASYNSLNQMTSRTGGSGALVASGRWRLAAR
jgi:hypothetical protein